MNRKRRDLKSYITACVRLAIVTVVLVAATALAAFIGLIPAWVGIPAALLLSGGASGFIIAAVTIRAVDRGALS